MTRKEPTEKVGRLYSLKQAAIETSLSRATLYRYIERGELMAMKLGVRTVISEAELERFKKAHLRPYGTPRTDRGGRGGTF
jgi:excisionase family DNA binding protein